MAQRDSEYKRIPHDRYETPAWVTNCVVPHLKIDRRRRILEPAAGNGKMVKALRKHGYIVDSRDIMHGADFLKRLTPASAIVTNPPYSLAKEFIEHALALTKQSRGVVAMLLRVDYDSASTRQHLFAEHPAFTKKLILTKRIQWFEASRGAPSENHCWMIWNWKNKEPPTIGYAP